MSDAYDKVKVGTYSDGSPMLLNKRTVAALDVVHEKLGYELTIVQGSYHKTTAASAGTHDGGGAVDLAPFEADKKVHAMRAVGFAAWHRLPSQGNWPEHVHGILRGDREMSPEAAAQIVAYDNHRDGLADNAPDNTWHPDPKVTFDYPHYVRTHNMQLDDDLYPRRPRQRHHDRCRATAGRPPRRVPCRRRCGLCHSCHEVRGGQREHQRVPEAEHHPSR